MYTVSMYYSRSETVYSFGPFQTERTLNAFLTRIAPDVEAGKYQDVSIDLVNSPALFESGSEVTFGNLSDAHPFS